MTAIPQPPHSRMVSQRIVDPLKQVASRQWSVLAAKGVLQTLVVSMVLLLVGIVLLNLLPPALFWALSHVSSWVGRDLAEPFSGGMPMGGRIAMAVLVWGGVLAAGVYLLRPAMRKRSLVHTAMDVELAMSGATQERITSSIELGQETDARMAGSPVLVQHLMRQAEADAAAINPGKVIPVGPVVVKYGSILVVVLMIVVAASMFGGRRFIVPLFNLLMPWQPTPKVVATYTIAVNGDKYVSDDELGAKPIAIAEGDALTLDVKVAPKNAAEKDRRIPPVVMKQRKAVADGWGAGTGLERTGEQTFRYAGSPTASFDFFLDTDGNQSRQLRVEVEPVPSVRSLTVRYEYPAFTRKPTETVQNPANGEVTGIEGTKATIIVDPGPTPLKADKALTRLVVSAAAPAADGTPVPPEAVELRPTGNGLYAADLTLAAGGSFKVELTNSYGRRNRDADKARAITVTANDTPTIKFTQPDVDPKSIVTATQKEPFQFEAADQYGVEKVELVAKVDGLEPAVVVPMNIGAEKWPREVRAAKAELDVAAVLKAAGKPEAKKIVYLLRATDNAAPKALVAETEPRELTVSKDAASLEAKKDAADLIAAIQKAIRELEQVQPQVGNYVTQNRSKLEAYDQTVLSNAQAKLTRTGNELASVANRNVEPGNPLKAMADAAGQIARNGIGGAAATTGDVLLKRDRAEEWRSSARQAKDQVAKAKSDLEELLKKTQELKKLIDAQAKAEEIARKQQELANKMQEQPQANAQPQQPNQPQQQLKQETDQLRQELPQDKNAEKMAEALNQLIEKTQELQREQEKQIQQTQKQAEAAEAAEKAKTIAEKQKALNEKVAEFAKNEAKPLQQAEAKTPEKAQLNEIVKKLDANQLEQAAEQQKQAAEKLEQNAKQLEKQAEKPKMDAQQQAAAEQQKQAAQQAQQQAEQAKQQAAEAKKGEEQANAAADKAKEAAKGKNAEEQKNAAEKAAQAAQQAAQQAQRAEQQAKGTEKKADAAAKNAANPEAQKAAEQAGEQAKKAQATAKEAQQAAAEAQKAAQQAAQAQQQGNKEQEAQATQQAGEKAQEAGQKAAQAAQQAADAAQQVAEGQKQAAQQAQAKGEQEAQQQAKGAAQQAGELAKEQRELAQQAAQAAQQAAQAQQQGAQTPKQAALAQQAQAQQTAKAAKQAAKLQQEAQQAGNQQLAQRAQAAEKALEQAQANQQQAGEAQQQGNNEQAAGAQEAAQNNLAKAEQALRGQMPAQQGQPAQAQAGKPGEKPQGEPGQGEKPAGEPAAAGEAAAGEQPGQGEPGQGEPGQGEPGKGEPGQGKPGEGKPGQGKPGQGKPGEGQAQQQAAAAEPHPGEPGVPAQAASGAQPQSAQQAAQQASQLLAEASNAQGQAAQGNAAAAQQAAQAAQQASQALAQAIAQQAGQGEPGQPGQPGQGQGPPSPQPSPVPGQSEDPKGIQSTAGGPSDTPPPELEKVGFPPGEWAKLSPQERKDFVNGMTEDCPPEYRQQMKNYYLRLLSKRGAAGAR